MKEKTIEQFINELASSAPTPGGGSAAALVGALTGALGCMVANLTLAREPNAELEAWRDEMTGLYQACLQDIAEDAAAYQAVVTAQKLPKKTDEEKQARTAALQEALKKAAQAPLATARHIVRALGLAANMAPMARSGYVSDLGVANFLALSALMCSAINVETNLNAIHDRAFVQQMEADLRGLEQEAQQLFGQVEAAVKARMAPTA